MNTKEVILMLFKRMEKIESVLQDIEKEFKYWHGEEDPTGIFDELKESYDDFYSTFKEIELKLVEE